MSLLFYFGACMHCPSQSHAVTSHGQRHLLSTLNIMFFILLTIPALLCYKYILNLDLMQSKVHFRSYSLHYQSDMQRFFGSPLIFPSLSNVLSETRDFINIQPTVFISFFILHYFELGRFIFSFL